MSEIVTHARLQLFFALEDGTDPTRAKRRYESLLGIYRRVGPPTREDAACIGAGKPCILPLERDDGTCTRTLDGRPVVVQFGVCLSGACDSWIRQFCLAQDRMAPSIGDDEVPKPVVILDAAVPSTLWVSPTYVRFLAAQPNHAHVHVCGLSPRARAFAEWVLAPLPTFLTERVSLHAGYEVLATLLAEDDLPTCWGGARALDLDAYGARVVAELGPTAMPWWDGASQSP